MIDVENEVVDEVVTRLREVYDPIYIYSEPQSIPAGYPAVVMREMSNVVRERNIDSGGIENYAVLMYQVSVYSNLRQGKKAQAKAIRNLVDTVMGEMGFVRTFSQPIENLYDTNITRYESRYEAATDGEYFYRR